MPADYESVNEKLKEYAGLLEAVCDREGAVYIDVQTAYAAYAGYVDGVHPTEKGQRLIAETIAAFL